MSKKMTTKEFTEKFHRRNPDTTFSLHKFEYLGDKVPSTVVCTVCNNEIEMRGGNVMQGKGCRHCLWATQNEHRKVTEEQWREATTKRDPTIDLSLFVYTGLKKKGKLRCHACEHEWVTTADCVMRSTGCPECGFKTMAKKRFYPEDKYIDLEKRLKADNISHAPLRDLKNMDHVDCRCLTCEHEWKPLVANLAQHNVGCPACANAGQGKHLDLSEEEVTRRLKEASSITGNRYAFIKDRGKMSLTCPMHGESSGLCSDYYLRVIPPCCAKAGYRVVYAMPVDLGDGRLILKLGFTGSLKRRMSRLGTQRAYVWKTQTMADEKLILDSMPYPTLTKEEFGRGWTETRILPEDSTIEEHIDYLCKVLQRPVTAVIER